MENRYLLQIIEACCIHMTFCFRTIWKRAFNNYIFLPHSYLSKNIHWNSLSSFSAVKVPINPKVLAILRAFLVSFLSSWFTYFPENREKDLQRMVQVQIQKQPFTCSLYRGSSENIFLIKVSANAMGISGISRTF